MNLRVHRRDGTTVVLSLSHAGWHIVVGQRRDYPWATGLRTPSIKMDTSRAPAQFPFSRNAGEPHIRAEVGAVDDARSSLQSSRSGALAGCARTDGMDGLSEAVTVSGDLLALVLLGIVLYMTLSRVIARLSRGKSWVDGDSFDLVSRRAVRSRRHAHHHRG
jgi:hypothetical protein